MMFSIRSFVLYAVGTSMCGGLLVLLCLPLCALLRRLRAPSKLLCLLWLAVGLRFLLPGGIPVSIRQPGSAAPIQQAGAVVQALTVPAELPAQALPGAAGSAPLPGSMFNIWVALAAIWAAGVVVLLVRAAAGYCRLRRMVTLACKTPDGCYTCAAVATPFTLGVLHPRIYMPQSLQGPPRRAVLLHERTHIRRGDPITKPLYYLAACLGGTRWRGWRSVNLSNTWNLPVTKPPSAPLPLPNALITAKAFCALPRCARYPVPSPLGRARWPSGWPTC